VGPIHPARVCPSPLHLVTRDTRSRLRDGSPSSLEETGPGLGRPWADSLVGTKLKELIPRGDYIRILFRLDPRKTGILLIGGDKQGLWDEWYKKMIPLAEKLYEDYPEELRKEGPLK
jgi:hypothetical protein